MVVPIHDASEVDDKKLHHVLKHALSHNKRLEPLSEYVKSCKDMTQKNIAALLRGVLRLSPSSSVENATVLLDVLDFLLRIDTPKKFPETFEPCRPHFDAAALKTLVFCRKNKQTGKMWWLRYRATAKAWLPESAVDRIFACTTDFTSIAADTLAVYNSCRTGEALVKKAREQTLNAEVDTMIAVSMTQLFAQNVTAVTVEEAKTVFCERLAVLGKDPFATIVPTREFKVTYRKKLVMVPCTCIMSMWDAAKEATLRGLAVDMKLMEPLWCEDDLVDVVVGPMSAIEIAPELLMLAGMSRSACHAACNGAAATNEGIKSALRRKKLFFHQLDASFKVWY